MRDISSIIHTIEKFYPLLEGFDQEKIPNNKYLIELGIKCDEEKKTLPKWNNKLQKLASLIPDFEIIDETLLEANLPSFMCSIINVKENMRMICYVSILCPYFSSFIQSEKNEYSIYINELVIDWLKREYPNYHYLSEAECRTKIDWIIVPSNDDDTIITTIAACIFGTRSFKGY